MGWPPAGNGESTNFLDPQSNDLDEWEVLIDSLAGGVLWDEDWRDGESLMDADPRAGGEVKKLLGVDEDYYIAVQPDPTDEEIVGVLATLRRPKGCPDWPRHA